MKMDKLRFVGRNTVDFPLIGADVSGPFILKGVDGLGPPDVVVRMGKTVLEKAMYQGKSTTLRQMTAVVGLQPDWDAGQTPEELRTQLYGLLSPKANQMIKVQVMFEGVVQAFAQGNISKMVPVLFSKDPAVQIVMDCDYGYLLAPTTVEQIPDAYDWGGEEPDSRAFDVINEGTAPSGFKMGVVIQDSPGSTLVLSTGDLSQVLQIDGIVWLSGDLFLIDTRPGSRGIWRSTGGGLYTSILNNLNASVSEWIYLEGAGINTLVLNTTAFDWNPIYNFEHQPAYWGV